jgi:hypothetical protein
MSSEPGVFYIPFIFAELKNRKKFEPTSIASPAFSAASISLTDRIPIVPA